MRTKIALVIAAVLFSVPTIAFAQSSSASALLLQIEALKAQQQAQQQAGLQAEGTGTGQQGTGSAEADLLAQIAALQSQFTTMQHSDEAKAGIKAQSEAILKIVESLKLQISTAQGASAPAIPPIPAATNGCLILGNSISVGSTDKGTGGAVSRLQLFLKNQGSYPEGLVTGYYGPATMRAVQRWQKDNGVVSSGSPSTTGYGAVGAKTRAAMACRSSGTSQPLAGNSSTTITLDQTTAMISRYLQSGFAMVRLSGYTSTRDVIYFFIPSSYRGGLTFTELMRERANGGNGDQAVRPVSHLPGNNPADRTVFVAGGGNWSQEVSVGAGGAGVYRVLAFETPCLQTSECENVKPVLSTTLTVLKPDTSQFSSATITLDQTSAKISRSVDGESFVNLSGYTSAGTAVYVFVPPSYTDGTTYADLMRARSVGQTIRPTVHIPAIGSATYHLTGGDWVGEVSVGFYGPGAYRVIAFDGVCFMNSNCLNPQPALMTTLTIEN